MQKITRSRSLLALGAFGLALVPLTGSAHAQPQPDRRTETERAGSFGRAVTLEGVVVKPDAGRNDVSRFRVKAGGKIFDVKSSAGVRVREGQRVVLRGTFSGDNDFNARAVDIFAAGTRGDIGRGNGSENGRGTGGRGEGNWNGRRGPNSDAFPYDDGGRDNRGDNDVFGDDYHAGDDAIVSFPGVITRVLANNEIEVRGDNGRTYRVALRTDGRQWQVGNRIRVAGSANGNRVENARLTLQNGGVVGPVFGNNGGTRDGNYGGTYNNGGIFGNRGDYGNGSYGNGNYDNGSYGNGNYAGDGVFGGSFENGKKVDFAGRIVSIDRRAKTAIVRGNNGHSYSVLSKDLEHYRTGDTVRVQGKVSGSAIEASDIDHI